MKEYTRNCPKCDVKLTYSKSSVFCRARKANSVCRKCCYKQISETRIKNGVAKGNKNPFYNKKHTDLTKKRMSENHADFTGEKNPFKNSLKNNPKKRLEHKERCQKIWDNRDAEYRRLFSSKLSLRDISSYSGIYHKNHKSGYYIDNDNRKFYYRSSWEETILIYLNSLKSKKIIQEFDLELFNIQYFHLGLPYNLRIDFIITDNNNQKYLLECKPKSLLQYNKNPIKICAYIEYCINNHIIFRLIHKEHINNIESFQNRLFNG